MIRIELNDRYIKGEAVLEDYGETARMSYRGTPTLPLNAQYEIEGKKWRVTKVAQSDFNNIVVNVDMVLVNDR